MEQKVGEDEYEILTQDKSNLWDQLRELMRIQKWTTQDEATTNLLQEMDNVLAIFIVRKRDNFLLGATVLIETADLVYGNVYVMREGYRASGMGMKLVGVFQKALGESFKVKPFIARGAEAMMGKYKGPPFYCDHLYELYSFELPNKQALLELIPAPPTHNYKIVAVRDLTPRQFQTMINFDHKITGVWRTKFLQDYYSIAFVEGVVLFNDAGEIKGMAGIVPTIGNSLYKVNPIYAESKEDAGTLVKAIALRVNDPKARFVVHVRTQSAGDWILKKCHEKNISMYRVGVVCNATNLNQLYHDPSNTSMIHAPTNSPAHFDG